MFRVILALAAAVASLAVLPTAANARADNRCSPKYTSTGVAYSCWGAYPEGFSVTGVATGTYRIQWSVTCSGRTVRGTPKNYGLVIHIYAGRLSSDPRGRQAYNLMIGHDLCRLNLTATRLSDSGSITLTPFINQNHPAPAHN